MTPNYPISFAGQDLSTLDGVQIYNYDFNQLPQREIKINKLARQDKSIITSAEYSQKEITIDGHICKNDDHEDAEASFSTLKSYMQLINQPLEVDQYNSTIQYTATLNQISKEWLANILKFTLIFIASDPIGVDASSTTLVSKTITTITDDSAIDVDGSFTALPVIRATINSLTGGSGATITLRDSATAEGASITRNWVANDILEVDSFNKTVTVNGLVVDYTGRLPHFNPGSNSLGYVDTFSARNITLLATYQIRYV